MNGVTAYFDGIADKYDAASSGDGWSVNEHLDRILDGLELAPVRVLDLGGGTGRTSAVLMRHFPDADVDLVEGSAQMAALARRAVPGVRVHLADVNGFLAAAENCYDLVVSMGVLEFMPDVCAVFARVADLLTPGGVLVFTYEPVIHGHGPQHDTETTADFPTGPLTIVRHHSGEMRVALGESGFTVIASQLFVAYLRGGAQPVVYELVVAAGRSRNARQLRGEHRRPAESRT